MISSWSKNAKQGPERVIAAARAAAARDAAAEAGEERFKERFDQHHQRGKATPRSVASKADKVLALYGIDLRSQEKINGRRIWTPELRRQVVRAAYSGHWKRVEITQAVGVYTPEIRKWAQEFPEETIPATVAKAPAYGTASTPLEEAIRSSSSLDVSSTTTEAVASTTTEPIASTTISTNNITPSLLNSETRTVAEPIKYARKSNKEILNLYGIDFDSLGENGRGRIFNGEVMGQIIKLLDSGEHYANHVLGHMGVSHSLVNVWRGRLGLKEAAGAKEEPDDDDDDYQDAAPGASSSEVRSMAPALAAGQIMKRAKRVAKYQQSQEVSSPTNTIKVDATSIDNAIGILELMRGNQEITKITLSISVVE